MKRIFILISILMSIYLMSNRFIYEYIQQISIENYDENFSIPVEYPVSVEIDLDSLVKQGKMDSVTSVMILFNKNGNLIELPLKIVHNLDDKDLIWFEIQKEIGPGVGDNSYYLVYSTGLQNINLEVSFTDESLNREWVFEGDFSTWNEFRSPIEQNLEWSSSTEYLMVSDPADNLEASGKKGYRYFTAFSISGLSFSGEQFFETENDVLKINSGWGTIWETSNLDNGITSEISVSNLPNPILERNVSFFINVESPFDNTKMNYFKIKKVSIQFKTYPIISLSGEYQIGGEDAYKYFRKITVENTSVDYPLNIGHRVMCEINTKELVKADKLQKNGYDLRVFYFEEDSEQWHQIERVIFAPNSLQTKVWFRLKNKIMPGDRDIYYFYYGSYNEIFSEQTFDLVFSEESNNNERIYRDDFSDFEEMLGADCWILDNSNNLRITTDINTSIYSLGGFKLYNQMGIYSVIISGRTNNLGEYLSAELRDLNGNPLYIFDSEGFVDFSNLIIPIDSNEKRFIKFIVSATNPGQVYTSEKGLFISEAKLDIVHPPVLVVDSIEQINENYIKEDNVLVEYENKFEIVNNVIVNNNRELIVSLTLENDNHVEIEVYNISGMKKITIFKGNLPSGEKEFKWNSSELTSGMYYVVVFLGNKIYKKPFIVIR